MKKLLTICLLVFAAAAFAGTDNTTNPGDGNEKEITATATAKKTVAKVQPVNEAKAKPVPTRVVCTTCSNDARFNISGYFAEFVNRNNLKLVKMLLD